MEWLNYHHLLYFWVVAREGSIVGASKELRLAQPTISGQIHRLEETLGEKLFGRRGRSLVLTEAGRLAFRYADEIFSLGREFVDTLKGRGSGRAAAAGRRRRGRAAPVARAAVPGARIPPRPARARHLPRGQVGRGVHRGAGAAQGGRRHRRRAGRVRRPRCARSAICSANAGRASSPAPELAASTPPRASRAPSTAPRFCFPARPSAVRRALEQWFDAQGIRPRIVAEFDDSALAKEFGKAGMGVFAAPTVIEAEVRQDYRVRVRRAGRRGTAAVLRHLRRAQDQAPRRGGHLRGRAQGHLRRTPIIAASWSAAGSGRTEIGGCACAVAAARSPRP